VLQCSDHVRKLRMNLVATCDQRKTARRQSSPGALGTASKLSCDALHETLISDTRYGPWLRRADCPTSARLKNGGFQASARLSSVPPRRPSGRR
jgi:hypothetical protein